jgi:hypothetical protein
MQDKAPRNKGLVFYSYHRVPAGDSAYPQHTSTKHPPFSQILGRERNIPLVCELFTK